MKHIRLFSVRLILSLAMFIPVISSMASPVYNPRTDIKACEIQIIQAYNKRHHTNFSVPQLRFDWKNTADYAATIESSMHPWYIDFNPIYLNENPEFFKTDVLPHEEAHFLCDKINGNCEHGPLWQYIAMELGLPLTDSYLIGYRGPIPHILSVPCLVPRMYTDHSLEP